MSNLRSPGLNRLVSPIAAVVLLLLAAGGVSAHASLVKSDPAPGAVLAQAPEHVQLWFDEDVQPQFSEVQVLDAGHARVDTGSLELASGDSKSLVVPLKPLGTGTFSVVWQVLSADDGHVTSGVFAFGVGEAAGAPITGSQAGGGLGELNPLSVAVRWLGLLSLLVLTGGFFFRSFLLRPSLRAPGIVADEQALTGLERAGARLLVLALLALAGDLLLQVNLAAGSISPQSFSDFLLGTRPGLLSLVRAALLLVVAILIAAKPRGPAGRRVTSELTCFFLSTLALLTRSLSSHAAAVQGDLSLGVLADWAHFAGVSIWVGGLVSLAWLLPRGWRALGPGVRSPWLAGLVARFSRVALAATAVIAVTGLYSSALQVPSLGSLVQTFYGNTLIAKVAIFVVMLLLGAINLLFLGPALSAAKGAREASTRLASRFRITLGLEVLLSLGAILAAGLLTLEPPARAQIPVASQPAGQPARVVLFGSPAPGMQVQLFLGPDAAEPRQFDVRVLDASKPAAEILRVMLNFTHLDSDTGSQTVIAEPGSDGHYVSSGDPMALDGMWRIRVIVRRKGLEDVSIDFPYYVAPRTPPADDPAAHALLAAAEARMNQLTSLRSTQYLNDGANAVVVTDYQFHAPDLLHFSVRGQGSSIAVGPMQYFEENGQWTSQARVSPYVFPQFDLAKRATWAGRGRQENAADGEPAEIVRFAIPNSSGPSGIQYAYWVSTRDRRVLQYAMVTDGHYMLEYYRDYDSPGILIEPPAGVTAPAAPATPVSAPAAAPPNPPPAAPLTGSRRLPGLVTGDLEGDGALLLLVAGIAAGALGLGGRFSRTRRLTAFGVATACIVAGLGLFVDAATATMNVNNFAVDARLADAGRPLYQEYCQSCHGPQGRGDGPGGAALPVKPFDLTTHVLLHDEFYLHDVILNGRGYMPAFGDQLTQDQIIQVIAYIRELAIEAQAKSSPAASSPQP